MNKTGKREFSIYTRFYEARFFKKYEAQLTIK